LDRKAIADYNKAIQLDPGYANAYNNRGMANYASKAYGKAIADFTKAIQLNPQLAEAYNNRAHALYQQKAYDKAGEDVKKAQELKYSVDKELLEHLKNAPGKKK